MYITTPMLQTQHLKSWDLTPRQLCDLEMLLSGAFLLLDVTPTFASSLTIGETIALRDAEGLLLAVFTVSGQFHAMPLDSHADTTVCLEGQLQGITLPKHHHTVQERQTPAHVNQILHHSINMGYLPATVELPA